MAPIRSRWVGARLRRVGTFVRLLYALGGCIRIACPRPWFVPAGALAAPVRRRRELREYKRLEPAVRDGL